MPKQNPSELKIRRSSGAHGPRPVLIVEDHSANLLVARTLIEEMGHACEAAADGAEALRKFANGFYSVIFMDIEMPELDGLEATRRIRAAEKAWGRTLTPIVAVTGHVSQADRDRCLEAGMQDYLAKPYRREELQHMLDSYACKRAAG